MPVVFGESGGGVPFAALQNQHTIPFLSQTHRRNTAAKTGTDNQKIVRFLHLFTCAINLLRLGIMRCVIS